MKKVLSCVLALCLLLTLLPTVALAADTTTATDETALKAAVASSGTVKLGADITLSSTLTVTGTVTLDLNGKTLSGANGSQEAYGICGNGGTAITVQSGGVLTIKDTSTGSTIGSIVGGNGCGADDSAGSHGGNGGSAITVEAGGSLTVSGGTIKGGNGGIGNEFGGNGGGGGAAIAVNSGSLTVSGGSIVGGNGGGSINGRDSCGGSGGSGIEITGGSEIEITGGEIIGGNGSNGGDGGGDIDGNGGSGGAGGNGLLIKGGTVTVGGSGTINGGNAGNGGGCASGNPGFGGAGGNGLLIEDGSVSVGGSGTITGGNAGTGGSGDYGNNGTPGTPGKATLLSGEGSSIGVSSAAALKTAVDAGASSIKLTGDIALNSTLEYKEAQITLDLNGHVLTGKIRLVGQSSGTETALTLIDSDPTATHTDTTLPKGGVVNGQIVLTRNTGGKNVVLHANGGTVTGTVTPGSAAKIDCTNTTPTAFKGAVDGDTDNGSFIDCAGTIYGGIFYGDIGRKYSEKYNTPYEEGHIFGKTITFMNGSTRYAREVVESGAKAAAPDEPTRNGYAFDGWYTAASGGTKFDFANTTITDSIILYAKWVKDINTLEITLSIDDIPREWSSNATVPYDGQEHTVAITVRDGDTTLTEGTDYIVNEGAAYQTERNAGNFDLSIKGIGNYAGSKDGGWQITAAPVTVKADDITVYVDDEMPTLTYTATGLIEGEDLGDAVTLSCDIIDTKTAGSYTITPSGAAAVGNYTVTYESGTLTVAERSDGLAWLLPVLAALDKEPFDDVKTSDWFYDDVQYAYETGLMTGTGSRTFSPDAPVTRGMVMTILARREGIRTEHYSPWYAAGVEWAVVNGISDGTNPEAEITREELATMLYRYAKLRGYDLSGVALTGYTDAGSVSGYAVPAMQWAVHSGLINGAAGVNAGKLLPRSTATRAQLAAILHRFFG